MYFGDGSDVKKIRAFPVGTIRYGDFLSVFSPTGVRADP